MLKNYPKTRLAVYLIGLAALITSFYLSGSNADLAEAFVKTANVLSALAGATAISNLNGLKNKIPGDIPEPEGGDDVVAHGFDDGNIDESVADDISEGGEADEAPEIYAAEHGK